MAGAREVPLMDHGVTVEHLQVIPNGNFLIGDKLLALPPTNLRLKEARARRDDAGHSQLYLQRE